MTRIRVRRFDWILLAIAVVLVTCRPVGISLLWGKLSFTSAYNKVRVGTTHQEWQDIQEEYGVQAFCDANDCYVRDVFRTYNVNFGLGPDGNYVVLYKRTYIHFPYGRQY